MTGFDSRCERSVRQFREGDYVVQAALAGFMHSSGYARHVTRMRRLYAGRQQRLRDVLGCDAGLTGGAAGLHRVMPLARRELEFGLIAAAAATGIALAPLSNDDADGRGAPGLVLS